MPTKSITNNALADRLERHKDEIEVFYAGVIKFRVERSGGVFFLGIQVVR